MKQELDTIGDKWQNIYDANPGITKLHDQGFLSQIYSTLHEILDVNVTRKYEKGRGLQDRRYR